MGASAVLVLVGVGLLIAGATGKIIYPSQIVISPVFRVIGAVLGSGLLAIGIWIAVQEVSDDPSSGDPKNADAEPPVQEAHELLFDEELGPTVECATTDPSCQLVGVAGSIGDLVLEDGQEIYVLVRPTDPEGPGLYLQVEPAEVESGRWAASNVYVGDSEFPARDGDQLELVAVLADAGFNVSELAAAPFSSLDGVEGVLIMTEPLTLTIRR